MQRRVVTTTTSGKNVKTTKPPPTAKKVTPPPPAAAPTPSKVIEASKKVDETLALLREQEALEQERVKNKTNTKVLSGEIDWYQYLQPKDTRDIKACAELDEYNHGVYEHNNAMLPKVNELLKKLGLPQKKLDPPTAYVPRARAEYEKMLFDENFRVLHGIKFLAQRNIFPVRDYVIEESFVKADAIAFQEEIDRLIEQAGDNGIDISAAVGSGHKANCTCNNRWDGKSERCIGEGVRVRWKTMKDHHFLRPRISMESY